MIRKAEVTPTITAGAYSSLDAVGGILEFENICTAFKNTGNICKVVVIDKAKQSAKLQLVLFDRTFTATADNAAFDPTDADLANAIGVITIATTDYLALNDNCIATKNVSGKMAFELVEGGTSIFGQLMVDTSTPTYVSTTDLTIKLVADS